MEDPLEKEAVLKEMLQLLKSPGRLKKITDEIGGANMNNPKYAEFKDTLLGVDASFENYFKDLEKIDA